MTQQVWTEEKIVELLNTNNAAVERAILAIYKRQTADEKNHAVTKHTNGVGFSGADASFGTYCAKWLLSGKHLSGNFVGKARAIALKYRKQLLDIALSSATKPVKVVKGSGHCEVCDTLGHGRITARNGNDVVIVCNLCDIADNS